MIDGLEPVLGPHVVSALGGGDICRAFRIQAAGRLYFAKTPRHPDPYLLPVEAAGLRQLDQVVPGLTPEVVHADPAWLVLEWVEQTAADPAVAQTLGRQLALLHAAPAGPFGAGPQHGRIGSLPMVNGAYDSWPQMYAEVRLRPLLTQDLHSCAALVDALLEEPEWAGPPEPASLLHGDLWSGNVVWRHHPRLVDPACHVGHRETDLAMLALFGAPHLDRILGSYQEQFPLAPGWQDRVALHQLWPLLVHERLFGGGYGQRAEAVAADYLRAA
ncbi:MAG TPA: fructosamine kinase family protein [Dermatophilaceae bacterium]|nr:fructosamine kinase family protein [Dermatophilaceae bacterium]